MTNVMCSWIAAMALAGGPAEHAAPAASGSKAEAPEPSAGARPSGSGEQGGDTSTDAGADAPDDAPESSEDVTRYQFTGLDIDGELRTPALLQFLARIGGEFETLGIPHRSFLPELQATSTEDAL